MRQAQLADAAPDRDVAGHEHGGAHEHEVQHQGVERAEGAFLAPLADQAEQQRRQREHLAQRLDVEVTAAVGQLAQHDRRQVRVLVEVLDERVDVGGQLGVGIAWTVDDQPQRRDQVLQAGVQDLVIQAAFVGEVVVDERLVDARAAGDAIHAGRVVAVAGELVDGGLENAAPGVAFGAFRRTCHLINQPVS